MFNKIPDPMKYYKCVYTTKGISHPLQFHEEFDTNEMEEEASIENIACIERNVIVNPSAYLIALPRFIQVSPARNDMILNVKTLTKAQTDLQLKDVDRIDVLSITEIEC